MDNVVLISSGMPVRNGTSATPAESHLSDAAARGRALDIRSSCIVEAPAGSGKTGLLMQRFLKLLADPGVSAPEEVLAITFTNKATAELRHRILNQLQAQLQSAANPSADSPGAEISPFDRETRSLAAAVLERDRELSWGLLERPQRLNIRTIDSVAAEIAHSLPLLSGSGGLGKPTENADALYREAARRTLRQLGGADRSLHAALRTVLLHRDGNLADCETLLARMLASREQWGELVPLGPEAVEGAPDGAPDGAIDGAPLDALLDREVRPRLERSLEDIVCAGLSRALQAMPRGLLPELTALAARLGLEPGYNGRSSPIAICAGRHAEPEAIAEHLDHWIALIHLLLKPSDGGWRAGFASNHLGFSIARADAAWLRDQIGKIEAEIESEELREALCAVRCLPPARFPEEQWIVARALFHLLRHALAELKILFAERGECDFAEFALSAREALRAESGAADAVSSAGARLQHLLVDEMQDTSSGQYELIELLTRFWDGHSQTLFLVGDPKQSIYLFRQARVERFLRTVRDRRLGDLPLGFLQLSANFRSQASLVRELNSLFAQLFPSGENAAHEADSHTAVPFTPATPARPPSPSARLEWRLSLLEDGPDRTETPGPDPRIANAGAEALSIRRIVEDWRARPLPEGRTEPWRVAVLARVRTHLTAIVEEFKSTAHGQPIRFRAVDIDPLAERPEVLDALALIRALLHPADRVAWLAVLHAPWCGLGLADLLRLTGEGPNASPDARPDARPDASPETTVAELVLARASLLSRDGQQRLARCWPVLQTAVSTLGRAPLAVQAERTWRSLGGDASLTPESRNNVLRVFRILREIEAEGSVDLPSLHARMAQLYSEAPAGETDVELLTIHKAKGLEWDVVIIPGMERPERASTSDLLNWLELDSDDPERAHLLLAPISGKGEASGRLNKWMRTVRAAREDAERKRLFYVACTRAREELHLFAGAKLTARGELAQPHRTSLLKACWPVARQQFERFRTAPRPVTAAAPDMLVPTEQFRQALARTGGAVDGFGRGSGLSLAAAAEHGPGSEGAPGRKPPLLHRLPLGFDPVARFRSPASERLSYPAAAELSQSPAFDRPEGSFAVRAYGNVVHRYLQVLSARQQVGAQQAGAHGSGATPDDLLAELPAWESRLTASFRGEGLAPGLAAREAGRALRSLSATLSDPVGRWILAPHPAGSAEHELAAAGGRHIRADRIFAAGGAPGLRGASCVWIVDFKTSDPGSRSEALFAASELAKYRPQLRAYAEIYRSATDDSREIHLGLYYPGAARFLHWVIV